MSKKFKLIPSGVFTGERGRFAHGAVLVVDVGRAVAGAEGRGGGEHQLLLDEAGLGVVLGELLQPLLQGAAEQVQALGRLAEPTLGLHTAFKALPGAFILVGCCGEGGGGCDVQNALIFKRVN